MPEAIDPNPSRRPPGACALLQAQHLAARRGERMLFHGLELALHPGEIVWLRGTNGRGKTTLLRTLAGLSSPTEGGVAAVVELAYIGHANALKDDLLAAEALRFLSALRGPPATAAAVQAALVTMGVGRQAHLPVRVLSQGQRRRVALARLALPDPQHLWLLDEPFDALDEAGIATLEGLLRVQAQAGAAVLLTSHQPLPAGLATRVLDLDAAWRSARAAA
ncbi:MAG: heme ABC exporter ATP-binding protein CcmA [Rubrivivax sp.]